MSKEKALQELSDEAVKLREKLFEIVDTLRPVTIVVGDTNPNNIGDQVYEIPEDKEEDWIIGDSLTGGFQYSEFQAKDHLWEDFSKGPTEIRINPYD